MNTRFLAFAIPLAVCLLVVGLFSKRDPDRSYGTDRDLPGRKCGDYNWTGPWIQPKIPGHLLNASQADPELIEHICRQWLIPPPSVPRRLSQPSVVDYSQSRQSLLVDDVLGKRTNGFFVECGAADGERLSNSLFFEKTRNWTGVLIEGYQPWFRSLLGRRRRAYSVGSCLSAEPRPVVTQFVNIGYGGGLIDYMKPSHLDRFGGKEHLLRSTDVAQCLPLYSILRAVGVSHVDYLSLDIEGAELEVIRTLPLDEITVDVFTIEYIVGNPRRAAKDTRRKLQDIKDYLVGRHGYEIFHVNRRDDVFLKRKGI